MSFRSLCNWFMITQVPFVLYIFMQYIHVFANILGPSAIDFKNILGPNYHNTSSIINSAAQLSFFFANLPPCWWEDLSSSLVYCGGWFLRTQTEEMVKQNREFILAKLVGFPIWIRVCIVPLSWIFTTKLLYYFWSFFYFFFFSEWRSGVMEYESMKAYENRWYWSHDVVVNLDFNMHGHGA